MITVPTTEREPERNLSIELVRLLQDARSEAKHTYEAAAPDTSPMRRMAELAIIYHQTRDWTWVQEQLADEDLETILKPDSPVWKAIEDGHGAWVAQRFDDVQIKPEDDQQAKLAAKLAQHGQAEWITRHLKFNDIDLTGAKQMAIVEKLCENGQIEWVLGQVAGRAFSPDNEEDISVLTFFAAAGRGAWVAEKIDPSSLHSKNPYEISPFLEAMTRNGNARWVTNVLEGAATEHQKVYVTLFRVLAGHGQAEWVVRAMNAHHARAGAPTIDAYQRDKLAGALRPHWRNPAVRAWLDAVPDFIPPNPDKEKAPADVFHYTAGDRATYQESLRNLRTNGLVKLRDSVAQLVALSLNEPARGHFIQRFDAWTNVLTDEQLPFVELVLKAMGPLSESFQRVLQTIGGTRSNFVVRMEKTGSNLYLYGRREKIDAPLRITFVNDISETAARAWKYAVESDIPVAPILRDPVPRGDDTRIYSRYCGKPAWAYMRGRGVPPQFNDWLEQEIQRIIDLTNDRGIRHGHTHHANFTVEFVRTNYVKAQIVEGKTINNMPFDDRQFSFNASLYFEDPKSWTPIVRLIDWDQASSTNP